MNKTMHKKKIILAVAFLLVVAGAFGLFYGLKIARVKQASEKKIQALLVPLSLEAKQAQYAKAKELVSPDSVLNTDKISVQDLIGKKVVLVNFWDYSCADCHAMLPVLNDWYKKYKDQGLEIIGVHTPEFDFAHRKVDVERAIKEFEIKYPVVQDNQYRTWSAYGNRSWPTLYLVDIDGYIALSASGKGSEVEIEKSIQTLLKERAKKLNLPEPQFEEPKAPAQPAEEKKPEPEKADLNVKL